MKLTRNRRRPHMCGHRGFGQFCHRCDTAEQYKKELEVLNKSKKLSDLDKKRQEYLHKAIAQLTATPKEKQIIMAATPAA